ncbi:CcmD family protein [Sphingobacterium deserti]|uniref:CcmD family protein n=1 Tax=Sphingobacterium deserti TaxID=1229276 RepID=A0A0B8T4Y1_9SPHI|nr:hypothetical protein [Sphingobacterium deserti]KGE15343.1 hypothetical protein DI53_1024 [Sphingobacterium deserti]
MKNSLAAVFLLLFNTTLFAQSEIDMATGLRSSGKIYVVVLVLLTIFVVLGVFLFLLDRRIKKLEK